MEEYVDANLSDVELTPASLQKKFKLSKMKMYEILREDGGAGPFILRRRLIAVIAALCEGELNVTEIMYRFGFSSESQFYRAFRARFDATPKAICMASRRIQELPDPKTGSGP